MNWMLDCGTECNWEPLPYESATDCADYVPEFSRIQGIIMLPWTATPPADWTELDDWVQLIDNTGTVSGLGRYIPGIGEVEAPETSIDEYPARFNRINERSYELELTVNWLSETNYAFLRNLQCCGPTSFRFWFYDVNGNLYGGPVGLQPYMVDVSFVRSSEANERTFALLTLYWHGQCDPERTGIPNLPEAVAGQPDINVILFGPEEVTDGSGTAFGPKDVDVDGPNDEAFGQVK